MKTIKNTMLAFAAAALVMPVFNGCKKGENDPMISLKSRQSRVDGEWTVTKMEQTTTTTNSSYSSTSKMTLDGTTLTDVTTTTFTGTPAVTSTDVYNVSEYSFVFDKKAGTYKQVQTAAQTSKDGVAITPAPTPSTTTIEGTWNLSGGTGETKKKSLLVLVNTKTTNTTGGTSSTSTNEGNTSGNIYMLDELKSKEMIWKTKETSVSSGTTPTTTVTETTMTLTAK